MNDAGLYAECRSGVDFPDVARTGLVVPGAFDSVPVKGALEDTGDSIARERSELQLYRETLGTRQRLDLGPNQGRLLDLLTLQKLRDISSHVERVVAGEVGDSECVHVHVKAHDLFQFSHIDEVR